MTNQVTYVVDLVPENAEKIDMINKILLGSEYGKEAKPAKTEKKSPPTTTKEKPEKKETKATGTSAEDLKEAAKAAKKEHGDDFAMQVLKDAGVEVGATLGRSIGKVDADDYDTIIKAWQAGPSKSDDLDEDGLGDDLDSDTDIDPEAVKVALKAYAKEIGRDEAKAIMTKNGAKALSNVDDCTQAQLAAMMKALV